MGAAYSSLGRTKVLYATSLVLRGVKAKFLRRKPSVCSGRRVFYSITTGRTTEIAEVSRRQPLEYWKIGPKVLTNGKLRREQLMLSESMMQ